MPDDPHPTDPPKPFLEFRAEMVALPMGIQSLYAASAGLHRLNIALRAIGDAMTPDKVEPAEAEATPQVAGPS